MTISEIILKSDALNLGNASVLGYLLSELDTHTLGIQLSGAPSLFRNNALT